MDLFSLAARLTLDRSDYERGIKESEDRGKTFVNRLQSTMGKAAKAVAVGTGAVATAAATTTVKIVKDAFGEYGELEQNLGGSEVVFKKHAKRLQEIGAQAYKNMGLSQSDFLATANKMGSLLKGSGIESEGKAAEMAANWMQRASDVASIMGISIEDAMEAVTGAAKGNFTMMDNLGVAMNSTTLEAYALSKGIAKSYNEMTQAEKIGLAYDYFMEKTADYAGNYAKENDTMVGSITSLKAAWSNFLSGAGDADAVVEMLDAVLDSISNTADTLIPRIAEGLSQIVTKIAPRLPGIIKKIMPALTKGISSIMQALPGVLKEVATGAANAIISIINGVFGLNLPEISEIRFPDWGDIVKAAGVVWGKAKEAVESIFAVVGSIDWPEWDQVKDAFDVAWKAIQDGAASVMKLVFGENEDGSIQWPTWGQVEDSFNKTWRWIQDKASSLMQLVFGRNEDGSIKWPSWSDVEDSFRKTWRWIQDKASSLMQLVFGQNEDGSIKWPEWSQVSDKFGEIWRDIQAGAASVMELIMGGEGLHFPEWGDVHRAAYAAWEDIKAGMKRVFVFFFGSDGIKFPSWEDVSKAAGTLLEDARKEINKIFKPTLDVEIPEWGVIESKYKGKIQGIIDGVKGIFNPGEGGGIWSTIEHAIDLLWQLADDTSGVLGKIFSNIGEQLENAEWEPLRVVGTVINSLGDFMSFISDNIGTIRTVTEQILAAVVAIKAWTIGSNFVAGLTGKGPTGSLIGMGLNAATGASGAGGATSGVGSGLGNMAWKAGKWFRNGWLGLKGVAGTVGDKLLGSVAGPAALAAGVIEAVNLYNQHQADEWDKQQEDKMTQLLNNKSSVSDGAQGAVDWAANMAGSSMSETRSGFLNRVIAGAKWLNDTDVYGMMQHLGTNVYTPRMFEHELYADPAYVAELESSLRWAEQNNDGSDDDLQYIQELRDEIAKSKPSTEYETFKNVFGEEITGKYKNWLEEGMPQDTQFMDLANDMTAKINELTTEAAEGSEEATEKLEAFSNALNGIPANTTKNVDVNVNYWSNMFGGIAGIMNSFSNIGSHADGLSYVPYDGYIAQLHRGEQVLSAANARKGGSGFDSNALYSSVANAISEAMRGVSVNMNGEAVGSMITPYVSRNIAQAAKARRYVP